MTDPSELSEAVCRYFGVGRGPSPRIDSQSVVTRFGGRRGGELMQEISSLLREADEVEIDWSSTSLAQAGEQVRRELKKLHPSLSDEALNALVWKFTYDWR